MTQFQVGDRVRIRDLPSTRPFAGRTGEVVSVDFLASAGYAMTYLVQLNATLPGCSGEVRRTFNPGELEPALGGDPS